MSEFSERDMYLMEAAFSAGSHYGDVSGWINDSISDCGHVVGQLLLHEANGKLSADTVQVSREDLQDLWDSWNEGSGFKSVEAWARIEALLAQENGGG
jgi:hypothetical protein